MMPFRCLPAVLALLAACSSACFGQVVIVNFDDRSGQPPPFDQGVTVGPQYLVDDEYLPQGVRFDSGGGGILIAASNNPVSAPNAASATGPGPVIDWWTHSVSASFWVGAVPGVVDSVAITMTSTTSPSHLVAHAYDGSILGSDTGGASATLVVDFPGQIHSVEIQQGPMGFDDFTFTGLAEVPEPATLVLLGAAVLPIASGLKSRRRSGGKSRCC